MPRLAPDLRADTLPAERIPVIDLTPLLQDGDPRPVAAAMRRACGDLGFFYVCNHGVNAELRNAYFAQARAFFDLPLAEKLKVDVRRSVAHRGFFPLHAENNDPDASLDLKEGFDIMAEQAPDDARVRAGWSFHGPNQWPDDMPGFRHTAERYYAALTALGENLMQAVAVVLDLPADFFDDKLTDAGGQPLAMLRMLHYPPQTGAIRKSEIGTGAHTDYGLLTILAQDDNGGLQIKAPDGGWIDAPPLPETFVVNIGDILQRWSGGRLKSTPHRVINTSGAERYSAPFFYHAAYDTVIDRLPSCEDVTAPEAPITAGAYMWQRFSATFAHHAEE